MKIALFSDIHANLPALEAFFEDVEKRKPDSIYCLGDLVGYNIWPNEVVNEIRKGEYQPLPEITILALAE
nr:metallophosphoesterase family protein [Elizabethkingia bruuniana]